MVKNPGEWLNQADYDMDTAEYMFNGGRYIYAVFMCHLSIEKALKGLYQKRLNKIPPKTHNLLYLIEKINLKLNDDLYDAVFSINRISVPTRYPDNLQRMLNDYKKERTNEIIKKGKEVLEWLKKQL
jgi:HEPN domain-containing protein